MAGEYFTAENFSEYWKKLRAYYQTLSPEFYEINKDEYDAFERSEREDSDNHINQQRLGTESDIVDASFYKYLPYHKVAYRTHLVSKNGEKEDHYFIIKAAEDEIVS